MSMAKYPLQWPDGWPRVKPSRRTHHLPHGGHYGSGPGWDENIARLFHQLDLMGAKHIVLSTNQPLRKSDGLPYSARRIIEDPGAAVYFVIDGRPLVLARDKYERLEDNIRSLALAVEGMRQMQRHGGNVMMERAYRGFEALPPPVGERPWPAVFGFNRPPPYIDAVKSSYRRLAAQHHPDRGGSSEEMTIINAAYEKAKAYYQEQP